MKKTKRTSDSKDLIVSANLSSVSPSPPLVVSDVPFPIPGSASSSPMSIDRMNVPIEPPPSRPLSPIPVRLPADIIQKLAKRRQQAEEEEFAYEHAIFCNRSLDMKNIKAVGFDMDYTLALYRPETFEDLAFKSTVQKLLSLGYPEEIGTWDFDHSYAIRGLVIDKTRGNLLKMDRHKYVKVAYHGFKELSSEERRALYDSVRKTLSFEEPDFALVDTFFSLTDAYLFTRLVDFKRRTPEKLPQSCLQLYKDVRMAVDLCHRDGSIKQVVCRNPGEYILEDSYVIPTLRHLKKSGKKLFLVTNSLWDYTHAIMNYLSGNRDPNNLTEDWLKLFDVVITGACKPAFFMTNQALYEVVQPATGHLRNVDDVIIDSKSKIFQGGNYEHLQRLLGVERGSQILYVGDHIYGDILRSKKEIGWRTMLVIAELEKEIEVLHRNREDLALFDELRHTRDALDDRVQVLQAILEEAPQETKSEPKSQMVGLNEAVRSSKGFGVYAREWKKSSHQNKQRGSPKWVEETRAHIAEVQSQRDKFSDQLSRHLQQYHRKFHPLWGQLFKTGYQNSRFATQVERYACLYTSRVTNIRFLSPDKTFRSSRDVMPHDPFWSVSPTGPISDDLFS
eukprot:CAMPEP_0184350652 /NCGR_PEP_ID=MMETSP1089-20130417/39919_1 /TAXON_ID=38269 ORGANISM="Gloeochaete wittrockiana, Strain SAG46.84" /NCGR_SAMPLE_ID=MMETSP1089 /ASSEMBLY_ACC=CAM_ASM_000445 /LENGTH=618 /DNA_ID=CAMNT_0026683537 /DNA_START=532 /DNA_END=2388 /DNA_ORIENTATION=+